jgi:hypothetical protein
MYRPGITQEKPLVASAETWRSLDDEGLHKSTTMIVAVAENPQGMPHPFCKLSPILIARRRPRSAERGT